jgi:hypothetical protein
MNNYLGVDNGISGGLTFLGSLGSVIASTAMPVQVTRKGSEINVMKVIEWVRGNHIMQGDTTVVIEEPGGAKSYKAATSMNASFHSLRALFELGEYKIVRITPNQWQKPFLKAGKGDTKKVAVQLAKSLWPLEKWLETPACRVPHLGMVDSALMAEWARRERL